MLGAKLYPLVDLEINDIDGVINLVTFIVDTGNDFGLVMPRSLIDELGLRRFPGSTALTSVTGESRQSSYYEAEVIWDGELKTVMVVEGVAPLLGRELMRDYSLTIAMRIGGEVRLERVDS